MVIRYIASSKLPTEWGEFVVHGFEETETGKEHIALTIGDVATGKPVLGRIHSECLTGDALFSLRCDCGHQLQRALKDISNEGCGVLLYLRQEGRGIGLSNKIKAYKLQDEGADTVEANEQLGFCADMRNYGMLDVMLKQLDIKAMRLMTNNPVKIKALRDAGIEVVERVPINTGENPHNKKYLRTKACKLGHLFDSKINNR